MPVRDLSVRIKRKNDLSLRLLEIFGAMMVNQTTTDTAAELGISQPAVSAAIKQLEGQLGFPLFDRHKRRLVPTDEARSLFREVEPIFAHLRSVENHVRGLQSASEGTLRMMATPPLGHTLVPGLLRQFLEHRPGVTVKYDVRRMEHVIEAVEIGSADVGLVIGLDDHPAVAVEILRQLPMVALLPQGHALAGQDEITPADCLAHGFIGIEPGSRLGTMLRAAFDDAGVAYLPRVEARYCHTCAVLSNAGIGIAIVDHYTAEFLRDSRVVRRPFAPSMLVNANLLTRKSVKPSILVRALIADIRSHQMPGSNT